MALGQIQRDSSLQISFVGFMASGARIFIPGSGTGCVSLKPPPHFLKHLPYVTTGKCSQPGALLALEWDLSPVLECFQLSRRVSDIQTFRFLILELLGGEIGS